MQNAGKRKIFLNVCFLLVALFSLCCAKGFVTGKIEKLPSHPIDLLTDPFLQLPTENSVRVVWFTKFKGISHWVDYGTDLDKRAHAVSSRMTRLREDHESHVKGSYDKITNRTIWRHEALVTGLSSEEHLPYRVVSVREDGRTAKSDTFTLQAKPKPGMPLKILLTSDHQLKPMTTANLQKVEETMGRVDAVFLAGDLAYVSDRASEWFDDERGSSFFPALQGKGHFALKKGEIITEYRGGQIIQFAPLYTACGNHEVMGRYLNKTDLWDEFMDPRPRWVAESEYEKQKEQINPADDPIIKEQWIKDHSYNTITYREILTLPESRPGRELYYADTFGDIRLISLFIARIWRTPSMRDNARGKFREANNDLNHPDRWGYGSFIFEPVKKGSKQYNWLVKELKSPEFKSAKYKIVMFHHQYHSLGENVVPAFTDPQQIIEKGDDGTVKAIRYEYTLDKDFLANDIIPLIEGAGVHLVLYGHSHLWNRYVSEAGTNYLETSNVGETYGAYWGNKKRRGVPPDGYEEIYQPIGNPYGLEPVIIDLSPLEENVPYIASNDYTVFSILDTEKGTVSSYYFDTRKPNSDIVKFDEFPLEVKHQ